MSQSLLVIMDKSSRKTVIVISIFLLLAGLVGIFAPIFTSKAVALLIGWIMLFAGIIIFFITWYGFRKRLIVWLKPFILVLIGLLILFHPLAGAAALGLILVIYLLLDGFSSLAFAWDLRTEHGRGWLIFNGVISLALASIIIYGWPFSSAWLVGFFIGISLFIDGVTLLMLGIKTKTIL